MDPHRSSVARIDPRLDSRAITFENPTGGRGAGGTAGGGRKGAPSRTLDPGEIVLLADIEGPGTLHHLWMTFPPAPPEIMRAMWLTVFYNGADEPSICVPCVDFFGVPFGRPVPYASALTAIHEGRGFNSYIPMPFARHVRVEVANASDRRVQLFHQIDYSLHDLDPEDGFLHVTFRREDPTTMGRDFVVAQGLRGPGRFLGCNLGIRVLDAGSWYGEGEVKVYRDGDADHPTICGTGLEDYVGSAWGLGRFAAPYSGAPLIVEPPGRTGTDALLGMPDLVGIYRWHALDPIIFREELTMTVQQIGGAVFLDGQTAEFEAYAASHPAAGHGWRRDPFPGVLADGITERIDDYCATAFVYCAEPQAVPRARPEDALAHIERRPYEQAHPFERFFAG